MNGTLPIKIKTTGAVLLTDELRTFINDKISKLEKVIDHADTTALCNFELESLAHSRLGGSFRAEITLTFKGGMARAEAKHDTLHAAIDEAIEEARREIRRTRTKERDLMRKGASQVKDFFRNFKNPF